MYPACWPRRSRRYRANASSVLETSARSTSWPSAPSRCPMSPTPDPKSRQRLCAWRAGSCAPPPRPPDDRALSLEVRRPDVVEAPRLGRVVEVGQPGGGVSRALLPLLDAPLLPVDAAPGNALVRIQVVVGAEVVQNRRADARLAGQHQARAVDLHLRTRQGIAPLLRQLAGSGGRYAGSSGSGCVPCLQKLVSVRHRCAARSGCRRGRGNRSRGRSLSLPTVLPARLQS